MNSLTSHIGARLESKDEAALERIWLRERAAESRQVKNITLALELRSGSK